MKRTTLEPKQVERDKLDRHIGRHHGKQIGAFSFPAESFLQIEEGELSSFGKGNDLAIEDKINLEISGTVGQFRELVRDPSQIAGKDFDTLGCPMQLGADAVEFILGVNRSNVRKSVPDCIRSRFRSCQHAFDRPEDRQFGPIQFAARGERRGCPDVAQEHVGFTDIVDRNIERAGDRFLDQPFTQTDPEIASEDFHNVLPLPCRQDR